VKPAALRVQAALVALGVKGEVLELAVEARTSQQAADAVGVGVEQIAKSLVFTVNGAPVMVVASGVNRVDERKLGLLAGGTVRRADAETVKRATGYTIGGVSESALTYVPILQRRVGFDPLAMLEPVSMVAESTWVLIVHPSAPARTANDLVALSQKEPGRLDYAPAGVAR